MTEQDTAFLTEPEAKAHAKKHGGDVEQVGVVFVVHPSEKKTAKEAGQDATDAKSDEK